MAKVIKSLARTSKDYVVVQGAVREAGILHVQGKIPAVNRGYGIAVDIPFDKIKYVDACNLPVAEYLTNLPVDLPSLAGTDRKYFEIRIRLADTEKLKVQIKSDIEANREYGASLWFPYIKELGDFLAQNLGAKPVPTPVPTPVPAEEEEEVEYVTVKIPKLLFEVLTSGAVDEIEKVETPKPKKVNTTKLQELIAELKEELEIVNE